MEWLYETILGKNKSIETHDLNQNPHERDMSKWKLDMKKFMVEYTVNPIVCLWVMQRTVDLHNHQSNQINDDNLPPVTAAKWYIAIPLYWNNFISMRIYCIKNTIIVFLIKEAMKSSSNSISKPLTMITECAVGFLLKVMN